MLQWKRVYISFGYIPRSGIGASYDSSILSFLWNIHIVFHSGCTSLYSYWQGTWVSFYPHLCQHLSSLIFLVISILSRVRWCLFVVLRCVFLMTRNVEYLFMYMLTICVSSLEKYLFISSAYFLIILFGLSFFFAIDLCEFLTYFE